VRWTFRCAGAAANCYVRRPLTLTLPVLGNVAAAQIQESGGCNFACPGPAGVTWLDTRGDVVRRFFSARPPLSSPPLLLQAAPARPPRGPDVVQYILAGNGLVGVPFGASRRTVGARLRPVIGAPSRAWVRGGSCGVDHQILWSSPRLAAPLTLSFRRGRFAGYQYGVADRARVGAGPQLATTQGLRIGDTLAQATRFYGRSFTRSAARGSWRVHGLGGVIDGYVVLEPSTGSVLSDRNLIATIDAGHVGCPAALP
jgi:hypothetical protein